VPKRYNTIKQAMAIIVKITFLLKKHITTNDPEGLDQASNHYIPESINSLFEQD
jgi:hypothetical protein